MRKDWTDDDINSALDSLYPKSGVPEDFSTSWRAAIRREEIIMSEQKKKSSGGLLLKRLLPVAAALVLIVGSVVTGQMVPATVGGDKSPSPMANKISMYDGASGAEPMAGAAEWSSRDFGAEEETQPLGRSADKGAGISDADERKIIRTADLTLRTGEFDVARERVDELVRKYQGYVESSRLTGDTGSARRMSYTLRIPSDKLDDFLNELETVARVTERLETRQDKTAEYQDTETRLKTQREKMNRLQELISQASEVADIIEIESAIADTQYYLDSYQTSLNSIDRRVDHATVSLNLREELAEQISQSQELSLGERIQSGFSAMLKNVGAFFQNMLVFITVSAPVWVALIVIGVAAWLIVKRRKKKSINIKEDETK